MVFFTFYTHAVSDVVHWFGTVMIVNHFDNKWYLKCGRELIIWQIELSIRTHVKTGGLNSSLSTVTNWFLCTRLSTIINSDQVKYEDTIGMKNTLLQTYNSLLG